MRVKKKRQTITEMTFKNKINFTICLHARRRYYLRFVSFGIEARLRIHNNNNNEMDRYMNVLNRYRVNIGHGHDFIVIVTH